MKIYRLVFLLCLSYNSFGAFTGDSLMTPVQAQESEISLASTEEKDIQAFRENVREKIKDYTTKQFNEKMLKLEEEIKEKTDELKRSKKAFRYYASPVKHFKEVISDINKQINDMTRDLNRYLKSDMSKDYEAPSVPEIIYLKNARGHKKERLKRAEERLELKKKKLKIPEKELRLREAKILLECHIAVKWEKIFSGNGL